MKTLLLAITMSTVLCVGFTTPSALAEDSTSTPAPAIYDTLANTITQISEALALAKETDRRVLIQWGANWCRWCRFLHSMIESDSLINHALDSDYVWVLADVGVKGKNVELMAKYGVDRKQGIPFFTVLATNDSVVINQETGSLETDDKENPGHDRSKLLAFLTTHAKN